MKTSSEATALDLQHRIRVIDNSGNARSPGSGRRGRCTYPADTKGFNLNKNRGRNPVISVQSQISPRGLCGTG